MDINCLRVPAWEQYPELLHGFLGRRGGKSSGAYARLNVSYRVGDDQQIVSQNVCDMKQEVGIHDGRVVTMKQVHGDAIIEITDHKLKEAGEADAMVTKERGIFLGVLTADCVPILLVAPERGIAAAVHAGWRGTLAGIAANTVKRLIETYGISSTELQAALGPSIGPCCYDVKDDVTRPLLDRWGELAAASLEGKAGKSYLDLRRLNDRILQNAGLPERQIFHVGPCTSCASEEFFSYRRQGSQTGRQMSIIGWR
jgi:polyphenol oxidase